MTRLPPLDLHAHVDSSIDPGELVNLGVVFAVTRELHDAERAVERRDELTIWGVGCHPGLVRAHHHFDRSQFERLLDSTCFVGEVGLDGKSRVPLPDQIRTLRSVLEVLAEKPRIVSLHSYSASEAIVDELERTPGAGRILHWWLGDAALTRRAVSAGCYFSIPPPAARRSDVLSAIPLERVLTETDHPFGDRGRSDARPGNVALVESRLAAHYGLDAGEVRRATWRNLGQLVADVSCGRLLPPRVRTLLAALPR